MKQGFDILGNPIQVSGNTVTLSEGNVIKKYTFTTSESAIKFFNRYRILNKRGAKCRREFKVAYK